MPLSLDFNRSPHAIVIRVDAVESVQELSVAYGEMLRQAEFDTSRNSVWDISPISLGAFSISEVREFARLVRGKISARGEGFKVALVTSRATDRQLLKLYLAILRMIGNNLHYRVFASLDEAIVWAG